MLLWRHVLLNHVWTVVYVLTKAMIICVTVELGMKANIVKRTSTFATSLKFVPITSPVQIVETMSTVFANWDLQVHVNIQKLYAGHR